MRVETVLKAMGEPMRFKIFSALLERKHCVRSLSKKFGITESAISQHIKVMRDADMIYGERYGYHIHYLPKQETVDALAALFTDMQKRSLTVERDMTSCQCEYRRTEEL